MSKVRKEVTFHLFWIFNCRVTTNLSLMVTLPSLQPSCLLPFPFLSSLLLRPTKSLHLRGKKGVLRAHSRIGVYSLLFSNHQSFLPLMPSQLMTLLHMSLGKYCIRIELPRPSTFTFIHLSASVQCALSFLLSL